MISYRPVPDLTAGRTGFKAAVAAMAMAALVGTTAFAPPATAAPSAAAEVTVATAASETAPFGRRDT